MTTVPFGTPSFSGKVERLITDSQPRKLDEKRAPSGAPNVLVIMLDDVGFGSFGTFGGPVPTPGLDRVAKDGLRYNQFHTTALCSPTRACLLTGRNHHNNGMARVVELASGFPGYDADIPPENGFVSEILRDGGYATFAVGKWHLTPAHEMAPGGPREHWPMGKGFDRFYGFLAGETDQYHPNLVSDGAQIGRAHV